MDDSIVVSTRHVDAPWIAADFAVLDEIAADVRLDVDLELFATKRTCHQELVCHLTNYSLLIAGRRGGRLTQANRRNATRVALRLILPTPLFPPSSQQ